MYVKALYDIRANAKRYITADEIYKVSEINENCYGFVLDGKLQYFQKKLFKIVYLEKSE